MRSAILTRRTGITGERTEEAAALAAPPAQSESALAKTWCEPPAVEEVRELRGRRLVNHRVDSGDHVVERPLQAASDRVVDDPGKGGAGHGLG